MLQNKTYTNYGISLKPLESKDLEIVRYWRNSEKINHYARDKSQISQVQQQEWFEKIDTDENLFFVIVIDDIQVGLIWARDVHNICETGFYIYEDRFLNSIYSYKIVTVLHKILFDEVCVSEIYCDILDDNKRAIRFNKSLGFKNIYEERYCLEKNSFYEKLSGYEKIIKNY